MMNSELYNAVIHHHRVACEWERASYDYNDISQTVTHRKGLLSYWKFNNTSHPELKNAKHRRDNAKLELDHSWKMLLDTLKKS